MSAGAVRLTLAIALVLFWLGVALFIAGPASVGACFLLAGVLIGIGAIEHG